jgi:hypothetical protein
VNEVGAWKPFLVLLCSRCDIVNETNLSYAMNFFRLYLTLYLKHKFKFKKTYDMFRSKKTIIRYLACPVTTNIFYHPIVCFFIHIQYSVTIQCSLLYFNIYLLTNNNVLIL